MLVLKNGDTVIKSFTYEELEKLISTTEEGINHSPKYVDKSCYINLTDADHTKILVTDIILSYSAFAGADQLTDGDKSQDEQWMRIYGTSANICDAGGHSGDGYGWLERPSERTAL